MKLNPKIRRYTRKLLHLSINEEGRVDEERISAVLSSLAQRRPLERKVILKYYLRLVEREIRATSALVETAGEISPDAQSNLQSKLTEKTGRKVDLEVIQQPDLIAGTRIRLGDDVYEFSIPSRLRALLQPVS